MARVVIIGAGVMASALTVPLGACGHAVELVGTPLDGPLLAEMAAGHPHPVLRVPFGEHVAVRPWTALPDVLAAPPDLLVVAVSTAGVGWAIEQVGPVLRRPVPVLIVTKGLLVDGGTIAALPTLMARRLAARSGLDVPVMAIGGPCIAVELAAGRDTSAVLTGEDPDLLARVRDWLSAPYYHVHLSDDVAGVEVCAAFKNLLALGVGAAAGAAERAGKAAHNLVAIVFNRAALELAVLTERFGGRRETAFGLAGLGDLHVTCAAGRNARMGHLLGQGLVYSAAKATAMPHDTVEGAELALALGPTLDAMLADGRLPAAELPLTRAVLDAICRDAPLEVVTPQLLRM